MLDIIEKLGALILIILFFTFSFLTVNIRIPLVEISMLNHPGVPGVDTTWTICTIIYIDL